MIQQYVQILLSEYEKPENEEKNQSLGEGDTRNR